MTNFPAVFEGIGKLKEFEVKLHIDDNVPPVAQRHRRIPFHQRQKVTAELRDLERNDIIERLNGPTPWCPRSWLSLNPNARVRSAYVSICENQTVLSYERHIHHQKWMISCNWLNNARVFSKVITNGVPAHIVRWLAAFRLDRQQQVKIGNIYSRTGSPNGGVPQGTLSGPNCFFFII